MDSLVLREKADIDRKSGDSTNLKRNILKSNLVSFHSPFDQGLRLKCAQSKNFYDLRPSALGMSDPLMDIWEHKMKTYRHFPIFDIKPRVWVPDCVHFSQTLIGQLQSSLWSNVLRVSSLKTHSVKIHHSTLTTTVRYRAIKQCSNKSLNLSLIPCYAHCYQEGHVPTIKVNRRHELSLFFTSLNILTSLAST